MNGGDFVDGYQLRGGIDDGCESRASRLCVAGFLPCTAVIKIAMHLPLEIVIHGATVMLIRAWHTGCIVDTITG